MNREFILTARRRARVTLLPALLLPCASASAAGELLPGNPRLPARVVEVTRADDPNERRSEDPRLPARVPTVTPVAVRRPDDGAFAAARGDARATDEPASDPAASARLGETARDAKAAPRFDSRPPAEAPQAAGGARSNDARRGAAARDEGTDLDPLERDVVVTTASRTEQRVGDTAVATRVMDREAIEASGAENLEELLEEAPGVQVTRSFGGAGGAGVRMQGLDPRYTLILIDGQRVNGRIAGVIDLSRFQAEDIEQIELVEGPSSSLYGSDAMAGVVNVITRKGRRPYEAEVHGAYGSFHTVDVSARAAMRRRRWGAQLSGGWHRTDGFVLPEEGRAAEDASTTGNAQSNANVALGADYSPDTPIDFSLAGRVDFQHRDIRGVDFRPPRANFDRRNLTRIVGATLTPELRWDAPARLRLIGRFNYFNDLLTLDQRGSDLEDRSERTIDQLGELTAQYDHQVAGAHLLTAGLTGSFEAIESPRVTDDQRARQRVALFVQDEWTIVEAPRVALVPGARLDHDTQFGGALSPKAALRVDPTSWLVLRASYGLGFRAPDFKELYLLFANPAAGYRVVGNPALKPERSRGADAGLTLRLPSRPRFAGELSLHYFHNVIDGLIAAPTSSSAFDADGTRVFRYENLDAARTRGGEVSAGLRLLRLVGLDGSYTFTDARERIVADDGGVTERPLAGRARHRGAARLWFHHPRWGLRAQVRAAINGAQIYYTEATQVGVRGAATVTLTPYATVDVRVAETFLERYTLFLGADNLANAGDPVYSPLVPRSFYGGFTIRY